MISDDALAILQDAAVQLRCVAALSSPDATTVAEGLELLGTLLNQEVSMEESGQLCATLREGGAVELLCALLVDRTETAVHTGALMVIGNLASDAVDPDALQTKERIRAVDGVGKIAMHLFSQEPEVVFYACGACMNVCSTISDIASLKEMGLSLIHI